MRTVALQFAVWIALAMGLASAADAPAPANPKATGRVHVVRDTAAVVDFNTQLPVIRGMIARGVRAVSGEADTSAAWRTLVGTNDVVGLKVFSAPGRYSGTRPAVVRAVIEQLLAAGVAATNIVIWDRDLLTLRLAGFPALAAEFGARCEGAVEAGWDGTVFYENPLAGRLVHGDLEFGSSSEQAGRRSHLTRLLTRHVTKIITLTPLLNDNAAGVTGHLLSLAGGSTDNFLRFAGDRSLLAQAVPEICALPLLGDRVALNITDALICQYEGRESSLLHYSAVLNELRFSTDPVALDALSLEEILKRRSAVMPADAEGFRRILENAALLEIGIADRARIQTIEAPPAKQ
jgi:hypothetical protein